MDPFLRLCFFAVFGLQVLPPVNAAVAEKEEVAPLPKAFIDGTGIGWRKLGESDFVNVNCAKDTWSWKHDVVHCTGKPTGVMRTQNQYTNFELVAQWQHLQSGGIRE